MQITFYPFGDTESVVTKPWSYPLSMYLVFTAESTLKEALEYCEKIPVSKQSYSYVHDEFFTYNINKRPFPTKRTGQQFVGEAFDENDNPNMQHRSMIPYTY